MDLAAVIPSPVHASRFRVSLAHSAIRHRRFNQGYRKIFSSTTLQLAGLPSRGSRGESRWRTNPYGDEQAGANLSMRAHICSSNLRLAQGAILLAFCLWHTLLALNAALARFMIN